MKKWISFVLLFCIILSGCEPKPSPTIMQGFFFDTYISITVYDANLTITEEDVLSLCRYYEELFSPTLEGSDVYRINHSHGAPVEIAKETAELIEENLEFMKYTDGLYDITIRPVSSLWDFSSTEGIPPKEEDLVSALSHVGYETIKLSGNTITLLDEYAAIDLGASAKGYIADRLKEYLLTNGVRSALINLGGNICTIGTKPDGTPFHLGVQDPENANAVLFSVDGKDNCLITSGIYERYFIYQGTHYHHILDATTGYPVNTSLKGVTIEGPNGTTSDILSTVCFLLGEEDGKRLLNEMPEYTGYFY